MGGGSAASEDVKKLVFRPDMTSVWQQGMEVIEARMEARRDDLRDKGMADGEQMECIIAQEKKAAVTRLEKDLKGETGPDTWDDERYKTKG